MVAFLASPKSIAINGDSIAAGGRFARHHPLLSSTPAFGPVATADNPNAISGINHACFTVEDFDPERVMAILIENGLEPIENGILAHQTVDMPGKVAPTSQRWELAPERRQPFAAEGLLLQTRLLRTS